MQPSDPTLVAKEFDDMSETYAAAYEQECSASGYFFRRRQDIVVQALGASPGGGLVLDVGCGPGPYAAHCVERGFRYFGLDLSPQMIRTARERGKNLKGAEFAVGDARRLPFAPESVDALLCLGVLEYIPEDDAPYLTAMATVVRPGGMLIFSFLNSSSPYWFCVDRLFPLVKFVTRNARALLGLGKWTSWRACSSSFHSVPMRKFRAGDRAKALALAGLDIQETHYFAFNVMPSRFSKMFPRQSVWASEKLERLLASPVFGWFGMAFVMVARKPSTTQHVGRTDESRTASAVKT